MENTNENELKVDNDNATELKTKFIQSDKKDIVINRRYIFAYLYCLLFSFATISFLTLITLETNISYRNSIFIFNYKYNVYTPNYNVNEFITKVVFSSVFLDKDITIYESKKIYGEFVEVEKDGESIGYQNRYDWHGLNPDNGLEVSKMTKILSEDSGAYGNWAFLPYLPLEIGLSKNNPLNYVALFYHYIFIAVPFYYYILFSLIYIPILWFFRKYKFKIE